MLQVLDSGSQESSKFVRVDVSVFDNCESCVGTFQCRGLFTPDEPLHLEHSALAALLGKSLRSALLPRYRMIACE